MRVGGDDAELERAERFCESHPRGHFMQSTRWAAVKSNWGNEVVIAEESDGRITGVLSVLIRKIPVFGNLMYCPRGPVCDIHDADALRQLTERARFLAKRYRAMALRMEPDVPEEDGEFRGIMEALGYKIRDDVKSNRDLIQPKSVFRLDLRGKTEEEIFAGFHKKLRYNIRLAQRRGVEIREGTREDIPVFYELMEETAGRDRFIIRPIEYYRRVWDELGPEHVRLKIAFVDGGAVAAAIVVSYAKRTWYAYGASATEGRSFKPCELLQWEMIRDALRRGDDVYDLRGFLEITDGSDPRSGLYHFKKQFGGELERLVGEVTLPFKPLRYKLYRLAEKALFTGRHIMTAGGHGGREHGAKGDGD